MIFTPLLFKIIGGAAIVSLLAVAKCKYDEGKRQEGAEKILKRIEQATKKTREEAKEVQDKEIERIDKELKEANKIEDPIERSEKRLDSLSK